MRWLLFTIAIVGIPCSTLAQDTAPVPVVVVHEGEPGMWFPEADARRMLGVWRSNRGCQLRIPILLQQVENRVGRIVNLRRSLDLSDRSLTLLERTNESLASTARHRWYTSPWLWLSVGLIVGAAFATFN